MISCVYEMTQRIVVGQETAGDNGMETTRVVWQWCEDRWCQRDKRIPQSLSEIRKVGTYPRFSIDISIFLPLLWVRRNINGADGFGNSLPLCRELVRDRYS